MLGADEDKPTAKGGQRKGKAEQSGKKAEPRKRKEGQTKANKPDQLLDALQRAGAQVKQQLSEPTSEPAPAQVGAPVLSAESAAAETSLPKLSPITAAEPVEVAPVSLQTIANAYGDYSKKSFEQTSAFVAKLAGARSFDKAFELQTAFAREAYETFVAQSRRIHELHGELARQRLTRLEGFVTRMTKPR